jgi:hypothetical protein
LVRKEVIANDAIEDYGLPFSKNISNAFDAGWQMFLNLLLAFAHLWMFILTGLLICLLIKYYKYNRSGIPVKS